MEIRGLGKTLAHQDPPDQSRLLNEIVTELYRWSETERIAQIHSIAERLDPPTIEVIEGLYKAIKSIEKENHE